MAKTKTTVTLEIVPADGKTTSKEVEIVGTGVSVKEFLKAAKLSEKNMNISVNDEPANLRTHVARGDKVTLTERARGS